MEPHLRFIKKQRLISQAEFDSVFQKSKRFSSKLILALYKTNSLDIARLGVIVSKRVAKSAVVRNQMKRIIRESFRMNQTRLNGLDIIVLMRQHAGLPNKVELREAIDQLWEKITAFRQTA